jgi:hypothetical protein
MNPADAIPALLVLLFAVGFGLMWVAMHLKSRSTISLRPSPFVPGAKDMHGDTSLVRPHHRRGGRRIRAQYAVETCNKHVRFGRSSTRLHIRHR